MEIEALIHKAVDETIFKLKKSNMIYENKKSTFKKTEELLRNYPKLKIAAETNPQNETTTKCVKLIQVALNAIVDDPYYEVIPLIFFKHKSRELIAEQFEVEVRTITRNKNRLINQLKIIIFSDEVIKELFL